MGRRYLALIASWSLAFVGVARADDQAALAAAHAYDMSLGSPSAKVTVVEYANIGSWGSARFNNEVMPHFKAKYLDTGRVRLVLREIPSSGIASIDGFLAARCLGQERYFAILDAIYRAPPLEAPDPLDPDVAKLGPEAFIASRLAQITGIAPAKLAKCLSDQTAIAALLARKRAYIDTEKLDGAPTFDVDGRRFFGFMTIGQMDRAVDQALAAHP